MSPFLKSIAGVALISSLTLFGCQVATDTKSGGPTATIPTPSSLAGSWKGAVSTSTGSSNGVLTDNYSSTTTLTVTADTWIAKTVIVDSPVSGATPTYGYSDAKGTYSLTGGQLTQTTTDQRQGIIAFADDTSGWTSLTTPTVVTRPIVLIDGKLYGVSSYNTLLTAKGSHSGIVGTWVFEKMETWSSGSEYSKYTWVFGASDVTYTGLSGTSPTDTAMQTTNGQATYVLSGDSTLTMTQGSGTNAQTSTGKILLAGNYLIMTSVGGNFGEYTKQ